MRRKTGAPAPWLRALTICFILLVLQPSSRAAAHPADMYAQSQSMTLSPAGLQLEWQVAPGPFLADAVWAAADQDHNGAISAAEGQAWMLPYLSGLSVKLDSQTLTAHQVQSVRWPATVDVLRTGEDRIQVSLTFDWPSSGISPHGLEIHNAYLEANSLNSFSLAGQGGLSFDQPSQNNGLLKTNIFFPNPSAAKASGLTSWDSGTPNLPGFAQAVSRMAAAISQPAQALPGSPADASPQTAPQAAGASTVTSALTGLVKTRQFSPLFLLGAFLLSLALGSLHALTPGHGKALVGAYLIGSHGKTRDAVLLGSIVTITHTGSVILLGFITLFASHYILPAIIAPWLEIASGVLVIAFGLNLLLQRRGELSGWLRRKKAQPVPERATRAASLPENAARDQASAHDHAHLHHSDANDDHTHATHHHEGHSHVLPAGKVTLKSLLTLGISGGLVPCPDAIAILLVAVAINRIPFGMLLIVSFSIGLALVLIGIGIAMVRGVRLVARSDLLSRFSVYTPAVSAVVVMGLGAGLTFSALNTLKFSASVAQAPATQSVEAVANAQAPASSAQSGLQTARVLYVASDSSGWDQLFMLPAAGGSPAQYTQESSGITGYSISPDQKTILYTVFKTGGGSSIWALDADGTNKRLVLDCPASECNSPSWYPDGKKIAYERLDNVQDTSVPRFSIWWLELASGKTQPVFQDQSFASAAPRFSPDGQWLSYISSADNKMVIYNLQNGRSLAVPLGSRAAIPESWSPAGDALLFGNEADGPDPAPLHAKIYSLATGQTTDLGANDATDYSAAWSPDGQWIAIDRSVGAATGSQTAASNQVWLVKPDGSRAHVLLQEPGVSYSSLNWSPDGHYLLFSRYALDLSAQNPGHFDIWITDIGKGWSKLLVASGDLATMLP